MKCYQVSAMRSEAVCNKMSGIKLTLDGSGEAEIVQKQDSTKLCLVEFCDLVNPDWICGHSGLSIWDYYRDPGWCPLFKWYRTSRNKLCQNAKAAEKKSSG